MSAAWQLQDAKSRFSELVDDALRDGPQVVTRRGEAVVVIVPIETWRKLAPERPDLKAWLRGGDLEGLDFARELGERPDAVLP